MAYQAQYNKIQGFVKCYGTISDPEGKNPGKPFESFKIWVTFHNVGEDTRARYTKEFKCSPNVAEKGDFLIGEPCLIFFDNYGRVSKIDYLSIEDAISGEF